MGFAQAGKANIDGSALGIQGERPLGLAMQGRVVWRDWQLLVSSHVSQPSITTPAVDTTGSTLIVVTRITTANDPSSTITDNQNNVWTTAATINGPGLTRSEMYYCEHPRTSTQHTFTNGTSDPATASSIIMAAFQGPNNLGAVAINSAANTGPTLKVGPVTTTNGLMLTALTSGDQIAGIDSGFAFVFNLPYIGGAQFGAALAYKSDGGTVSESPTWTAPQSGEFPGLASTIVGFSST